MTSLPIILPDAPARLRALTEHNSTLLVEAGAGSGKTALMAGRVALLVAEGVPPADIVAITFTEAAASELLERIERFVAALRRGDVPAELRGALPSGLSAAQQANLDRGATTLDEITCTTIHGFCQQLVRPYPVETGIDPGAAIIDPAAAELAYQDLMQAWLSARFGRDRSAEGLGRVPPMPGAGGEEDFFAELVHRNPDGALDLIQETAKFLKNHRTATAPTSAANTAAFGQMVAAVDAFAAWYNNCGVVEESTADVVADLGRIAGLARDAAAGPLTGRKLASLLFHEPCSAEKKTSKGFGKWGRKGRWKDAAKACGRSTAAGEQLSTAGEGHYNACDIAYAAFCDTIGALVFSRFVAEFDAIRDLYRDYKRQAALMDFDDLLHHARDLLRSHEPVRRALALRYPRILVDEFQDTDPLQAEILWHLAGEGDNARPWQERQIRPGALFLVGDPKQAIYRFRGADVETYLIAKRALASVDPGAILEISANFRSQAPVLEFVNAHFAGLLDVSQGQPGFSALAPVRAGGAEPAVAAYDITIEDHHRNDRGDIIVDAVRREEAKIVADIVRRLIGAYQVWDKGAGGYRPARAADIALLAPTGTSLWIYERALETRSIPIATQAGKGFFRRQEVQDLIAVARAIADGRDTLALGALLRGPLVGLTEEEIADEIDAIQRKAGHDRPLHLWTDLDVVANPIAKRVLAILQNLARKARTATPHQLMAEAVEELQVRPLIKARYQRGAERALANVDLLLEMARPYAARGTADFAQALRQRWEDGDTQAEGRPDAEADAVSIVTMHSSKGLEWPIVIPINSCTELYSKLTYVYRRSDDTVHFPVMDYSGPDYETVKQAEADEQRRERVRLWYVALTRARDLLLLPRQSEREANDWFSLLGLDLAGLPTFDASRWDGVLPLGAGSAGNAQDLTTWQREAAAIIACERRISWHQPSRHEGSPTLVEEAPVFASAEAVTDWQPATDAVQGGRERGLVLHKLLEEVLTGETQDTLGSLKARAAELLRQMGLADHDVPADGPSSAEMAATTLRGLELPDVAALRPRLRPEVPVYAAKGEGQSLTLTAGVADAVASDDQGQVDVVVDWKSDVAPDVDQIELYRQQVRDYLAATGAKQGLIVFLTSGRVERVAALFVKEPC